MAHDQRAITDYTSAIEINPLYTLAFNGGDCRSSTSIIDRSDTFCAKDGLRRLGAAGDLTAESEALAQRGKALAEKNCSWCPAIGSDGDSPNPKAPQFRNIQSRYPLLTLRAPLSRASLHLMIRCRGSSSRIARLMKSSNILILSKLRTERPLDRDNHQSSHLHARSRHEVTQHKTYLSNLTGHSRAKPGSRTI
jgi:hypothetical protein